MTAVNTRDPAIVVAADVLVPAAPPGQVWQVMSEGGMLARGERLEERGFRGRVDGNMAMVQYLGAAVLIQLRPDAPLPPAAAGAAAVPADDESDLRVLPIKWKTTKDREASPRPLTLWNITTSAIQSWKAIRPSIGIYRKSCRRVCRQLRGRVLGSQTVGSLRAIARRTSILC